ncbi:HprK-related kinase A [Sulfuricystis thermophila]|uniref:HprK-related kinase A n=1 Tax=Sulfuricystis thermophila TaxID=2496847 RepID=UPI0010359373|nr:HprK-related kinase A [Sulfuricystis thermophila]
MRLADSTLSRITASLRAEGLWLQLSPFVVSIRSDAPGLADVLLQMYADFSVAEPGSFADFHIELRRARGLRRWIRPQVDFHFDGMPTFHPLPLDQAYPMLEWGLNWCIASHAHQFLIIHAAVIERGGRAVIMPAPPGSGKSTLCAALVNRGWRLLSDELALLAVDTGQLVPLARPINLKNRSIEIIRRFVPECVMTSPVHDTRKGMVALMRPPADSVRRIDEVAVPAWVVFPKYLPDTPATFLPFSKGQTCLRVAQESFNYDIHGRRGFEIITRMIDGCDCYEFSYGDLEDAMQAFDSLAASTSD